MRIILAVAAILPLAALAGCQSEDAARNTFREASIRGCLEGAHRTASPAAANADWNRFCACATDRIMAGKSARELAQLRPNGPGQQEIVMQCLQETGMNTAPAGAPGAAAPAATGNASKP